MAGAVPPQSAKYFNSDGKSAGVKIATSNLFIESEKVPIDYMVGAVFDDIGGQELINSTDRDGVLRSDGSIIGNINDALDENNPGNILNPDDGTPSVKNEFAINFGSHYPRIGGGTVSRYTQKNNYLTGLSGTVTSGSPIIKMPGGTKTIKIGQIVTGTSGITLPSSTVISIGTDTSTTPATPTITLSANVTAGTGSVVFRVGRADTSGGTTGPEDFYSQYVDEFETNERVYFSKNQIDVPAQTPTNILGLAKITTLTKNTLKTGDQIYLYGVIPTGYVGQYQVADATDYSVTIPITDTTLLSGASWTPITKPGKIQTDIGVIVIEHIGLDLNTEEIEVEFLSPYLVQSGIID